MSDSFGGLSKVTLPVWISSFSSFELSLLEQFGYYLPLSLCDEPILFQEKAVPDD